MKVEDSMWSVDKASHHIFINLEKQKETMWKSVFQGEEGIDLTKVDTTRDISEFDQEAQAAIQRVTFDHQMKMMGKPTSSEQVSLFPPNTLFSSYQASSVPLCIHSLVVTIFSILRKHTTSCARHGMLLVLRSRAHHSIQRE